MHHALYRWGIAGPWADVSRLPPTVRVQSEDLEIIGPEGGLGRWGQPVSYYHLNMAGRDMLFDEDMVALRDCLSVGGSACDLIGEVDRETLRFLDVYEDLYRQLFWRRHDLVNRHWIAEQLALLERFEDEMAERVTAAYGGAWPAGRSRVDVSFYANEDGGYTTSDGHIVVSSNEIGNQGHMGLELLFHEASHGATLETPLRAAIDRSFAALDAEPPPGLWHLIIFYTAGHITRQVLDEADVEYPETFAEFSGLWDRYPYHERVNEILDAHWAPALAAGEGFEEGMRHVARAWTASLRSPAQASFQHDNRQPARRPPASCSLRGEGHHRVDARRPAGGDRARHQPDQCKHADHARQHGGLGEADTE